MAGESRSVFDLAGGEEAFVRLVEAFYRRVETDPLLRPLYPDDLTEGKEHLALFLIQFFGGPTHYDQKRGHPRLRGRHLPFAIGTRERDAWLTHMRAAVDEAGIPEPPRQTVLEYFERAANFLMNQPE